MIAKGSSGKGETMQRENGEQADEGATAGDVPSVVAAWTHGWAVSRAVPRPAAVAGGWRIDVGLPGHQLRYVLYRYDQRALERLIRHDNPPGTWIKVAADPGCVHGDLPSSWKTADTGYLMTTTYRATESVPPPPYTIRDTVSGQVVTALAVDVTGQVAASAKLALTGSFGIIDQVETAPAHRRRGLGSAVMHQLARRALQLGADTGVLVATDEGRRLYRTLGWTTATPIAAAYLPEPAPT